MNSTRPTTLRTNRRPRSLHVRRPTRQVDGFPRPERRRQNDRHAHRRARRADAGDVLWRGAPITPAERARFGYMPEERGLYPRMCVRDQLVYLGRLCGRSAKDARAAADSWLERLNLGPRAQDHLDALSHGNQQRVQLIAALINKPELDHWPPPPLQVLLGLGKVAGEQFGPAAIWSRTSPPQPQAL